MIWILLGALFVLLVRNQFDTQAVAKDIRRIARSVRKIVRELARTVRQAVKEAKRETAEARKTGPEQAAASVKAAQPVQAETQQNNENNGMNVAHTCLLKRESFKNRLETSPQS